MSIRNLTTLADEEYLRWLCKRIDCRGHEEYESILWQLYFRVFYSLVPNDDNRGYDGLSLREQYEEENRIAMPRRDKNRPANLLEVLVALAERMSFILFDPGGDNEPDTSCFFWELIENLNLDPYSNKNQRIIDDLLERRYSPNGKGGLFPLKNPSKDQRDVELWYQMQEYINEHYM